MSKELQTTVVEADKIRQYLDAMNLTSNLSKPQVQQFIEIAQAFGLNPFKREIYASKYNDNFSIIVGYEVYIKRAERSGALAGWNVVTDGKIEDKSLKAIITIYRKDWNHPFTHEVYYTEYLQTTYDKQTGQKRPNKFWSEKPITMLKKVAISQGFRLCFSDELGGMPYTSEEMGQETVETNPVSVETVKPNPAAKWEEPAEAPAKKGRPKKDLGLEELIVNRDAVFTRVYLASSVEELTNLYKAHPSLKDDKDFIGHLTTRKVQLTTEAQHQNPENPMDQVDSSYEAHMAEDGKLPL